MAKGEKVAAATGAAPQKRKEAPAEAERLAGVEFVRVGRQYSIPGPWVGDVVIVAHAGDVLRADDPLLDTTGLDKETVKRLHLHPHDTRFRVDPAPDAKAPTVKVTDAMGRFHAALGYQGYLSEDEKKRIAKLSGSAPAASRQGVRTEPSSPVKADDLAVPERDRVETE